NDLVEATRLARRMVTRWGMGSLGSMALNTDDEQPFLGYELAHSREYSEETAAQIDHDVQQMLDECYTAVKILLTENREKLDRLSRALLKEETIEQEEIKQILGDRTFDEEEELQMSENFA
ncbi:MAG: hypothetical protein ACWGN2_04980, partial [Anaerolineales bacterium]